MLVTQRVSEALGPEGRRMIRKTIMPSVLMARRVTAFRRPLPDFVMVGAQKSGTSALFDYLVQHPDIKRPLVKEIHYFDNQYERGLDWYRSFFPMRSTRQAFTVGEASPYYMFHPHAVNRLATDVPDAKIIVVLREPGSRAYSHYHMERQRGHEPLSTFREAAEAEEARLAPEIDRLERDPRAYSFVHQRFSYLARGRYAEQIQRVLKHWPAERVLFVDSQDLKADIEGTVASVFGFLELSPFRVQALRRGTYAQQYPPISANDRAWLNDYFAPHNRHLAELIGPKISWLATS